MPPKKAKKKSTKEKPAPVGRPTKYKPEYCQAKFQKIKHEIINNIESKWCSKCKQWFSLVEFSLSSRNSDGLQSMCKNCEKKYRDENKEEVKKRIKKWAILNTERLNKSKVKWKKENPEKIKESFKKYNKKYTSTAKGKLAKSMSCALCKRLKTGKNGKRTFDILPYTVDELKNHLERTMPKGYSWNDYISGRLHVDHIIPISVFNFDKPADQDFKRCWDLSNLQLLPAFDNISKSNKLTKHFQPSLIF